jgi:long-subunit acyl-CoA synthetase (AMP-forming)
VELTHASLSNCFAALADEMPFGPSSIILNTLPTCHISGVGPDVMTFYHGAKMVFHPDFDPPKNLRAITEQQISHVFFVPALICAL